MAKKLSSKTWAEVQKEMSIAGDPKKITVLAENIGLTITNGIDLKNLAEYDNMEFALKVVIATLKEQRRVEYERQHP